MTATQRQIRSSSLLLAGRLFAVGVNLAVQVLTVRYLGQSEFGAFAYAMSLVATIETISTLGLDRTVGRFVPTYHELGDVPRLFGTLATIVATVITVGVAAALVIAASAGVIIGDPDDALLRSLIVILVALGPIQALDHLCENLIASFGRARPIVLRRHVLGPLMKLGAIVLVTATSSSVTVLASAYVVTGLIGLGLFVPLLISTLRDAGVLGQVGPREIRLPVRELFAFALPLLAIDVALAVRTAVDAILVEANHGTAEVAVLRSVQPVARLNQLVFASFAIMFTPIAARLVARDDAAALEHLYWQSAAWQALVSFPIVAVTAVFAADVSILLFGAEYAASGAVLTLLAIGYYVNAATGQNQLTLRVIGRIRWVVLAAVIAGVVALALDLALIPALGAVGAAVAAAAGLLTQNVVNQVALHRLTPIGLPPWRIVLLYLAIVAALGVLAAVSITIRPGLIAGIALVAAVSLVIGATFRRDLDLAATFPEAARIPLIGRWL